MLRILALFLLLPLRFLVFCYLKLRARHGKLLLDINIKSDFSEAPLAHGIWAYFKPAKDRFYLLALELHNALIALELKRIKLHSIRVTFESHSLGWAQAWELRDLLKKIRAFGVEIHAYLLSDDKVSLFIASAANKIHSPETATFDLAPFTSESLYVQSLLAKLGVRPQFLSVGEFKSAAEIFTRTGMSPAARKQTETLIADLEGTFFSALAEKSPASAAKKSRRLMSATTAQATGLIDAISGYSEFLHGTDAERKLRTIDMYDLEKIIRRKNFRLLNFRKPHRIALLVAEGNIIESPQSRPGTINWPDYEAVAEALHDNHFDGALLRINSPGGSALVSQLLWREWTQATGRIKPASSGNPTATGKKSRKEKKREPMPVFVSQGNVAASGGYYLSAVGDRVFSTPMTITGSIGVVGGKFNVAPLLNKLGVTIDRAPKKNPSPAFSFFSDFAGEQKKMIRENMHEVYEQFLRDVARGRNKSVDEIRPHASGRVFSGRHAQKIGLTDTEGGITTALAALRDHLGLTVRDPIDLMILPAVKESLFNRSLLPFGISRLVSLADFAKAGIYALETRFMRY